MRPDSFELGEKGVVVYTGNAALQHGGLSEVWPCIIKRRDHVGKTRSSNVGVKCVSHIADEDKKKYLASLRRWEELPPHSNVVKLIGANVDAYEEFRKYFLVMECVPYTVEHLVFNDKGFGQECTYRDILQILVGVCGGLSHLHEHTIIHQDLQPHTVMITKKLEAKLADFGLAKTIIQDKKAMKAHREAWHYIAPETYGRSSAKATCAIDVFAFGVFAWVLLNHTGAGETPKKVGPGREIKWGAYDQKQHHVSVWCGGPEQLCALVESCLQYAGRTRKRDHGRPSVDEILETLEAMMHEPWSNRRVPSYCKFDENHPYEEICESLLDSIRDGNLEQVQALLKQGADVDTTDAEGRGVLHLACLANNDDILQELLKLGANANHMDMNNTTPVQKAVELGHPEAIKLLGAAGAELNIKDKHGLAPLHKAAFRGDSAIVDALLISGADLHRPSKDGSAPLHEAAFNGHTISMCVLIAAGADVLQCSNDGNIPLHEAAFNGHVESIKLLLRQGCDVNQTSKDGSTPLNDAALKGHEAAVIALLEAGGDVHKGNKNGWTPLHEAALNNHLNVVNTLISSDASVQQAQNDGSTALHLAAKQGHREVMDALILAGAEIDCANKDGWIPLHFAADNGQAEALSALIEAGSNVNQLGNDGSTPLHRAALNGHAAAAKTLLDSGGAVNKGNGSGWTPLHFAASGGSGETLQVLLDAGALVSARSAKHGTHGGTPFEKWSTPLHFAAAFGKYEAAQVLLKNGASKDEADGGEWLAKRPRDLILATAPDKDLLMQCLS